MSVWLAIVIAVVGLAVVIFGLREARRRIKELRDDDDDRT